MALCNVIKKLKGFKADSDNRILYTYIDIYNRLIDLLISETL